MKLLSTRSFRAGGENENGAPRRATGVAWADKLPKRHTTDDDVTLNAVLQRQRVIE
jgi:hypothetical protein